MIVRAITFLACLVIGLTSSTYMLVARIGEVAIPAQERLSLFGLKFVPPWLWVKWSIRYGERFPKLFHDTSWPIYASVIAGIALAWLYRLLCARKDSSNVHGSARWAMDHELKKTSLLVEHGVVLGQSKSSGEIIRHDGPEHVLAIAPTRGGKGVGLVIPTLLDWRESTVIFDPKGENWQVTSGYRSTLGTCLFFNPTSHVTARFNPFMEIRKGELEVKDAQNIADIIVDPDGKLDSRNHWQNAAHSLLVGTILHVLYCYERKSLAGVVEFLTKPNSSFEKSLEEMLSNHHPVVKSVAQEMLNKHVEERSGVLSTAISLLSLFRDPLVAHATDSHDFAIMSLRDADKPVSLYLVLPPSDISRLRVLLRLMLNQIGRVLTERQEQSKQRVLFLLDEFPALGRLEFFESALAYVAGYGIKALLICQSLNQLQKAYGERNAILDNCHVRVAFANNDDQTARRLSDLLGEQTLTKQQTSISGSRFDAVKRNSSISNIEFGRPLLLPSEINRLANDQEIILVNGMFPILAHKVRYFSDKRYSAKVFPPVSLKARRHSCSQAPINELPPVVEPIRAIGSAL